MKITHLVLAVGLIAMGATLFGAGCATPSTTCSQTEAGVTGVTSCGTLTVDPTSTITGDDLDALCTRGGGKLVDSCPSKGIVGTCTYSSGGVDHATAYYGANAPTDETICKQIFPTAKWTTAK